MASMPPGAAGFVENDLERKTVLICSSWRETRRSGAGQELLVGPSLCLARLCPEAASDLDDRVWEPWGLQYRLRLLKRHDDDALPMDKAQRDMRVELGIGIEDKHVLYCTVRYLVVPPPSGVRPLPSHGASRGGDDAWFDFGPGCLSLFDLGLKEDEKVTASEHPRWEKVHGE